MWLELDFFLICTWNTKSWPLAEIHFFLKRHSMDVLTTGSLIVTMDSSGTACVKSLIFRISLTTAHGEYGREHMP